MVKKLTVLLVIVALMSMVVSYTLFTAAEESTGSEVVYENDFEEMKMDMEVGTAFDTGTIGWKGNAHVTWDEKYVINGMSSAHFWINGVGAWHKAGQISLPGTESTQYTFRMKYRWLSTDVNQFGIVKFADSNRGVAFDGALEDNPPDTTADGINWAHNGGYTDLLYAASNDLGGGVRELIFVQTSAAGDTGLYFSAGDGGAEYVIDDIVITKGDTRNEVTAPIERKPAQAGTLAAKKDFEDASYTEFAAEDNVAVKIDEEQPISGKKSLMASVSAADASVTKKMTFTPDAKLFEKGQYYTLTMKVKSNGVDEMYIKGLTNGRTDPLHEAVIRFTTGQHQISYGVDLLRVDYIENSHNQITYGFCYDDATKMQFEIWFNSNKADAWLMFDDIEIVEGIASYYSISARTETEGGSVIGGGIYRMGEEVTLTASAEEGYDFVGWYEDKELISESAAYIFSAEKNVSLTAKFELKKFTVTVEQAANGSISPQTQECTYGSDLEFTFVPDAGYRVEAILVDGEEIPGAESFKLENVVAEHNISARFAAIEYTVSFSLPEGVNASPCEGYTLKVRQGADFKFTLVVAQGYDASEISVKAGSFMLTADANGVYTIENITADKTITVSGVVKEDSKNDSDTDEKTGCGATVFAGSALCSAVLLAGVAYIIRKRKED